MRRVVVTGMGILSPIGIGKEEVLMNLERSTIAIDYISSFDASNLPVRVAAEVKNFDVEKYIDRKLARRTDRFVHFALAAFKEALDQAKIDLSLFS
jgi:3-oxoacyl-[acyl-carrier-protein] synthase II